MRSIVRFAPACALSSILFLAAGGAWAQAGAGGGDTAQGQDDDAPGNGATSPAAPTSNLPGVAVERNIFVPVDGSGHPTSNQYIVVERRVLAPGGESADSSSSAPKTEDVPTRFILVPQEAGDDDADEGNGAGPGAAPQ